MIINPSLLKESVLSVQSKVFVCGPGYTSNEIEIRNFSKQVLQEIKNVEVVYGEEIEKKFLYRKKEKDLQTLEVIYAHDVDFTLLILESPGSIAELGTFTQIPDIRDRLVVLVSNNFYGSESYISRGPLSLLAMHNPNSVIYYDKHNKYDLKSRVIYHLTFYKYANFLLGRNYQRDLMISRSLKLGHYSGIINPIKKYYEKAISLISIIISDRPSYSDLLLFSGLAPDQLNQALHELFIEKKIEKIYSGRYRAITGYQDRLLNGFNSTSISKMRARMFAGGLT